MAGSELLRFSSTVAAMILAVFLYRYYLRYVRPALRDGQRVWHKVFGIVLIVCSVILAVIAL